MNSFARHPRHGVDRGPPEEEGADHRIVDAAESLAPAMARLAHPMPDWSGGGEMVVRLCGAGLLGIAALALHLIVRMAGVPAQHQPGLTEMLLSLAANCAAAAGAAALAYGPALFRPCRWPPRDDGDDSTR